MGVARKRKLKWSEAGRLKVLKTIVKVEETMIMESRRQHSSGRLKGCHGRMKWNEVMTRLPPHLRERTWNSRTQQYRVPKCILMFNNILYAYRRSLTGKVSRGRVPQKLSEPVMKLLQRHEYLLNAKSSVSVLNSLRSPRSRVQQRSKPVRQLPPSAREVGTATSSVHNYEFESAEEVTSTVQREGQSAKRSVVDREKSAKKDTENLRLLLKFVDESDVRKVSSFPAPGSRVRAAAQTQRLTRSQARAYVHDPQSAATTAYAERRATSSRRMCSARKGRLGHGEEHMQAITEEPLRKLRVELSRLSSWVLSQETPLTQSLLNELGSTDFRPGKRQKCGIHRSAAGTDTEIFDELIRKSVSTTIDNQVRDSFDKLRTLILKELKRASLHLAQRIVEEARFLKFSTIPASRSVSRPLLQGMTTLPLAGLAQPH